MTWRNGCHFFTLDWSPVPLRPWNVRTDDGRVYEAFKNLDSAQAWLKKRGYEMVTP